MNRRIVLAARPRGMPTAEDFRLEETPVPDIAEGQVLLRTLYLSVDPYMRNLMEEVGPVYAPSVPLGDVMPGGTVGEVVASRNEQFKVGETVLGASGWQDWSVSNGDDLRHLGALSRPSLALGALGMTAFTAYVGLLDIGQPRPGETVVVAAATGAVGSAVGQLAKLKGARVVGIAGGASKCAYAVNELGFDACVDRHDPMFREKLAQACPAGIDVYFENVGGPVFEAVLPLLNVGARVPVCGVIAHYNDEATPTGQNLVPSLLAATLQKRIRIQGFIILDHYETRFDAFLRDMSEWLASGRIKAKEHVLRGLESAPAALIGLLRGDNLGKVVVDVAGG
jgi:NADPH-dependent curcumin reductase CurA